MPGTDGYGTIAHLRALKRLEKDYDDWPVMRLRVQALSDSELVRVREYATVKREVIVRREADGKERREEANEYVNERDNLAACAFGLVKPDLMAEAGGDFEGAVALADMFPPVVVQALAVEIYGLSYRPPSQAFRDFTDGAGSTAAEEGTAPSTSSSASSSTSPTPASSGNSSRRQKSASGTPT